jgi:phosphoribosylaminoimidazolecarboxamide formyltransferase/IMP cyclohydrolase
MPPPTSRALLSVSDKTGVVELAQFLVSRGVLLLSTGGTAAALRTAGLEVEDVSAFTGSAELLGGRVKSMHPRVQGAILRRRGEPSDDADCDAAGIPHIDYVVCNLYPFEATVARGAGVDECVENIDIGGPSMIRAAAKNHRDVCVLTSPAQYEAVVQELTAAGAAGLSAATRRRLAAEAFARTASYDAHIAAWASRCLLLPEEEKEKACGGGGGGDGGGGDATTGTASADPAVGAVRDARPVARLYTPLLALKYGVNPHQTPAALCGIDGRPLPFTVRNGAVGAINVMDALNAYQLVRDLAQLTGLPAAASFKHLSPAGAAVAAVPLSEDLKRVYEVAHVENMTPTAEAYVRARGADPKSSFGDFVAVSGTVDAATAAVLRMEVSDGIIADGFDDDALAILAAKKGGKFVVLQVRPECRGGAGDMEFREIMGVGFAQLRNEKSGADALSDPVTACRDLPAARKLDLQVALVTLKYTQSNSIGFALDGQMVAVAAGQQSRIDCTRLAAAKARTWALRQHPRVTALRFRPEVKRQERINARVAFIEGEFGDREAALLEPGTAAAPAAGEARPAPLTAEEIRAFLAPGGAGPLQRGLCLASDAFFPFRDNIDFAAGQGVRYIAQPGGSNRDDEVIAACDEHKITMVFNGGTRLFHH